VLSAQCFNAQGSSGPAEEEEEGEAEIEEVEEYSVLPVETPTDAARSKKKGQREERASQFWSGRRG
jgi:hypothetical protein